MVNTPVYGSMNRTTQGFLAKVVVTAIGESVSSQGNLGDRFVDPERRDGRYTSSKKKTQTKKPER